MTESVAEKLETSADIERLFLRLVCADSNAKLQRFTDAHLFDILGFAGKSAGNLPQVMELLQHYNRMVKTNLEIRFPVDKLILLFEGSSAVSTNLSLIYLKMSKTRTPAEQQIQLIPTFLAAIDKKPNDLTFSYEIFALCFEALQELAKSEKNKWTIRIEMSQTTTKIVSRIFEALLLYRAQNLEEVKQNMKKYEENGEFICEGLSPEEYFLISQKIVGDSLKLEKIKLSLVQLLNHSFFVDEKVAFPLIVVAAAANLNVVDDAAESAIKKFDIQATVDDDAVVRRLMAVYLGSSGEVKKPTDRRKIIQTAPVLVKQKILPFLTRSKTAPMVYMNNVKICIDGMEFHRVARLQNNALSFLHAVIDKMPPAALKTLGSTLFSRLAKFVTTIDHNSAGLCLVYRCLGTLGKSQPALIFEDISIVNELFDTIVKAGDDVGYAVVDCLVAWLPAFCQSKTEDKVTAKLKEYIANHVSHVNPKCRMVSLKYIEALIDENEMDLKWMLLRASGDSREEMRQEANRLLELSLKRAVPSVELVVETFWNYLKCDIETEKGEEKSTGRATWNALIHQMCSKYLWACCETMVTGKAAELRIVEGDEHWIQISPLIFKMITENQKVDIIDKCVKLTLYAIRESLDVHQYRIATCFLMCLLSSNASSELKNTSVRFPNAVQACCLKARDSTRLELSQSIAFLISSLTFENTTIRQNLFETSKNDLLEKNIPGLCWISSAFALQNDQNSSEIMSILLKFATDGYERPSSMLEAALGAIGFLLQHNSDVDATLGDALTAIAEKVAASRKDSLSQRAREAAARVIGWIVKSVGDDVSYQKSIEPLCRIGEGPPQPELQLTVGEAMIDAMFGQYSASRRNFYVRREEEMRLKTTIANREELELVESRVTLFVTHLIDEKLTSANHHLRRAALVWLLVVVQRLSKLEVSAFNDKQCLSLIQNAFADGLTENDEFTQDIASKGMGIVYGIADAELRKQLVSNLMGALSEGRRTDRKVDGQTVLFDKGQLGKTPSGDNLTTYKELCTLATDLNQPDLVYKFMQLAKHNATWNAKKGAAFGFGAVLEQAKDELEPYFAHLVPKLFRYRYDPDLKVQASMRSIWSIVTANRRNVVDEFADEIAAELEPSLINKEWRVRESACLALSDLLRGHDTPQMHRKVPAYLETVLRVRDDIKESVRLAADKTAESIRRLIVRLASSTNSKKADEFLATVLPMLVDQGIVNATVKSNKIFCLALVLEMTKTAGRQLKPYLDKLIPTLLDSISDNESAILNYVAVRSDAAQLEALDDARAQMARTSPMMSAINDVLPHIDSSCLINMTPKVCDQLRASVGVSTRSAAAQLITQLALRAPQLMMDHRAQCDKLFHSLIPGVRDRNPSIRKQFANSMSYLAKYVSNQLMMQLIKSVVADLQTENEELKLSAKHVLRNLSANCSELLTAYATQIVPYVFLETCQIVAKGDEPARLRHEEWTELWAELVPSTSSAARLYKTEIVTSALDIVKNNEVWSVRAQAARMIARTVEALAENVGNETADLIVQSLLPTLSGRIWAGKEEILTAISKTLEAGGEAYKQSLKPENLDRISTVLKREASKKNVDYSSIGLAALARYCRIVEDLKAAEWLAEKVVENIDRVTGDRNEDDSDDEMNGMTNLEKEIRISKIVTSNLVALVASLATFRKGEDAKNTVEKIVGYMRSTSIAWKSKQNMFVELATTVEKWHLTSPLDASQFVLTIFEQADEMVNQQKNTVAADALQVIIRMQEKREYLNVDWDMVNDRMKNGKAGQTTGLSNRLDHLMNSNPMEID